MNSVVILLPMLLLGADPAGAIDFDRDVRPIISHHCYPCHGPDGGARRAGLRLDRREDAFAPRTSGRFAIVPGDAGASLLVHRVTHDDPDVRMPPAEANRPLSAEQIAVLSAWIEEGAAWSEHWAFTPPAGVAPPAVADASWPRNGIDRFVLADLERDQLAPTPEADRVTLARRASFALTGLPPTADALDAFLADDRDDAYGRFVDGLLGSPRYGERMAADWLDAARYADTHGYHYDNERTMWVWRDWVIDAFNTNLPYDRFVIEQLAGDLLPDATRDQRIATGFNRNHPITWEGGVIPEEYRIEYVVDRVNTTATVFMGLTMGCARCHDHKFDPISMTEFYAFAAFFNSIPEKGADGLNGNAVPFIPAPEPEQAEILAAVEAEIETLEQRRTDPRPDLDAAQAAWADAAAGAYAAAWHVLAPTAATAQSATLAARPDGSLWAEGDHGEREVYTIVASTDRTGIVALRLEALADPDLPGGGPGRASHSNFLLSEIEVEAAPRDDPAATRPVRLVAAHADHSQPRFFVGGAIDGERTTGWAVNGMPYGEDRVAVFVADEPFGFAGGTVLTVRLRFESDYTRHAMGRVRLAIADDPALAGPLAPSSLSPWETAGPFEAADAAAAYATEFGPERAPATVTWTPAPDIADGRVSSLADVENCATYLRRTIDAPTARAVTLSLGSDDALRVWLNGTRVLERDTPRPAAPDQDIVTLDVPAGRSTLLLEVVNYGGAHAVYFDLRDDGGPDPPLAVASILGRASERRSEAQAVRLRDWYRARNDPAYDATLASLADARRREASLLAMIPTVMVMEALDEPRPMHRLERGRYDMPREPVAPGVPAVLPPLPASDDPPRLRLARWLAAEDHPLTARVAVNRAWRQHFGRGLVETVEDFGVQGQRPTHPELLDWLARWFVDQGWDQKALHRLIVTSATYRQASAVTGEKLARDPANTRHARGPRFRLPAEMIRDAALSAGGLLVERIGGPPVKPYQPPGLWREVGSDVGAFSANVYVPDTGDALYRRTLYTFWKRTLPPPALAIFDAPSREYCVVRRSRTNTPLQALVTLNDPTYVEAARGLAGRMLREGGPEFAERATLGFRLVTGRPPEAAELAVLERVLAAQRETYREDDAAAAALLGVGASSPDADLPPAELAAWTVLASVLLNLDETLTSG